MPRGRWRFDRKVTDAFDDMLERSIPQYEVMRQACYQLVRCHAVPETAVVDLGCSRGGSLRMLVADEGLGRNYFIGYEVSRPMLAAARREFRAEIKAGRVRIERWDLRSGRYPISKVSVTQAVLTLQFVAIEYRQQLVSNVYASLVEGGAFLLVEKVLGNDAAINEIMTGVYLRMKSGTGYTQEQIERKRLSLEGVLVPMTAAWNEDMLRRAGFRVECFWRWMNFGGWVAVK